MTTATHESPVVPLDDVVPSTTARDRLGDLLNKVAYGDNKRIGITRNGKVAAVLIGMHELDLLDEIEMAADMHAAERALADTDDEYVDWDVAKAELDAVTAIDE
jgi:prevent-host-death family protein